MWAPRKFGVGIVWRPLEGRRRGARPDIIVGSVSRRGCEGRRRAGTYGDLMALAGRGLARHLRLGTCHQCRHSVDEACCRRGGVAGAEPPHKGGPNRPDRPELQWSVDSGQWSETALILAKPGMGTDHGLGTSRGLRKFAPVLGCTVQFERA